MARLHSKRRGSGICPRTRTPLNGLTRKCSSEHRPGPGFRAAKSERPLRAQGFGDMPRIKRAHQSTARGRDFAQRNRKATPGGAAQAARRSGSEMSQTSMQRRRPAKACRSRHTPERGCLRQQTGVEMARLHSKRRGLGDMPRFKRIRPDKKAGPATRGRPLNFAVTGGYYSSTIGLYLGTRAFMMLHAST